MADRILGMGDIVSLVEKAQKAIDEKEARELQKKIAKTSSIWRTSWRRYSRSKRWATSRISHR